MESLFSNILMFILGLLGLSFLVTIHELGHFLVAKWNNVKVNTFSIGFGKKLIRYRHGETDFDDELRKKSGIEEAGLLIYGRL